MPISKPEIEVIEGRVEVLATVDLGTMWDRLLGEFLNEWSRITRDATVAEVEVERHMAAFMDDLSEKPMEDIARKSASVAYNQGRGASIRTAEREGEVEYVVRSEVLDDRICDACASLDSSVIAVNSPDFERFMPPAMCFGGDRCRGLYVAVA